MSFSNVGLLLLRAQELLLTGINHASLELRSLVKASVSVLPTSGVRLSEGREGKPWRLLEAEAALDKYHQRKA